MSEWQPIETAPASPRVLLWCSDEGFNPNEKMGVVFGRIYVYADGDRNVVGEGMSGKWTFTHWMPLPDAPA